jgi:hypothetical protein
VDVQDQVAGPSGKRAKFSHGPCDNRYTRFNFDPQVIAVRRCFCIASIVSTEYFGTLFLYRLAIRRWTPVLERWSKQAYLMRGRLTSRCGSGAAVQAVKSAPSRSILPYAIPLGNSGTYLCVLHGLRPLHYVGSAR